MTLQVCCVCFVTFLIVKERLAVQHEQERVRKSDVPYLVKYIDHFIHGLPGQAQSKGPLAQIRRRSTLLLISLLHHRDIILSQTLQLYSTQMVQSIFEYVYADKAEVRQMLTTCHAQKQTWRIAIAEMIVKSDSSRSR